jgi:hypothetical protein
MDPTQGVFLQMSDKDGGGIHQSPSFTLAPPGKFNIMSECLTADRSVDVPPMKTGEAVQGVPARDAGVEPSANPYKWDDQATPTDRPIEASYPGTEPTSTDRMPHSIPSRILRSDDRHATNGHIRSCCCHVDGSVWPTYGLPLPAAFHQPLRCLEHDHLCAPGGCCRRRQQGPSET